MSLAIAGFRIPRRVCLNMRPLAVTHLTSLDLFLEK